MTNIWTGVVETQGMDWFVELLSEVSDRRSEMVKTPCALAEAAKVKVPMYLGVESSSIPPLDTRRGFAA